ncbi:MAG: hypothetical protein AVDCRST_MAG53-1185 [uncultured Solirubrobacteraceae bacterium]|uniref:Integration host factor-like helix-two turn-helix domain-containing protein n=1 Tax=uncultured Solirubrobacteraceae bacterium TaxID=1162706 RepID=A0A6J4RC21_9ACTN|nr:MAG: hypothetical protein AVDCRST_MAG53-1185 [uncultured Solirubrobacteraceae bacterium]
MDDDPRMKALRLANEIRSARARLKRNLKAGRVSLRDVLREPPQCAETAKVVDMLLAVPKYGRVKANKLLKDCAIPASKTIGGLSQRQREALIASLPR